MKKRMSTYKLGLIGFPIEHSHSPRIQQFAFDYAKVTGEYSLFPISPDGDWKKGLSKFLDNMRQGGIQGLNVTVPFKKLVMEFLDSTSAMANIVGAVNTIYSKNSQLIGENTDIMGFWTDLTKHIDKEAGVEKRNALILGAGGAARAVVFALISHDWQVWISARRHGQALEIVHDLNQKYETKIFLNSINNESKAGNLECLQVVDNEEMLQLLKNVEINLVVNTTPLGMPSLVDETPWQEGLLFPGNALVYDLVYNPSTTRMMKQAKDQGLRVCNGLGMLVEQAILSFQFWTGVSVPSEIIRQRLEDEGIR
jgi:shikimate dehydrogenase